MRDADTHLTDDELVLLEDEETVGPPSPRLCHVARCVPCQQRRRQQSLAAAEFQAWYRESVPMSPEQLDRARQSLVVRLQEAGPLPGRVWRLRLRDALAPGAVWALPLAALLCVALWSTGRSGDSPGFERRAIEPRALPIASLTPGIVMDLRISALCAAPPARPSVPGGMQREVLTAYGMLDVATDQYELDYLITPELGGATDPRNLWPQRYGDRRWNARVKDELEALLPRLVCNHQLDLAVAQHDMAADWIAAYKKYFRTSQPRRIYSVREQAEDDEVAIWASEASRLPVLTLASMQSGATRRP